MIEPGSPIAGANSDGRGVNFALVSSVAEVVELCLFDASGAQTAVHRLARDGDTWSGYLPGCGPGQHYGYRVHGPWQPDAGLLCNPHKLLLDPYARELSGSVRWNDALFGYENDDPSQMNSQDSAAYMPRCVVPGSLAAPPPVRDRRPWSEAIVYEANVRGFTMRHPALSAAERGTFKGLANGAILDHLAALGVTALELLPVHTFVDEYFLARRGLRNFWGYNTLGFFAPETRYLAAGARGEFAEMVEAMHERGIEVILDVVYNHTAEGNRQGPTFNFRGIDNLAYYRTLPDNPGVYINDTGCGNTLNIDSPVAQEMVLDSLRYWHSEMGVDGFRFDLAPILGRTATGFTPEHPFLKRLAADPQLSGVHLIAEPWDVGPGGYQLGNFAAPWCEWNDRYRDNLRRFWRGDSDQSSEFARRIHGSADLFEHSGRRPVHSVNFITSHDGFTLADLVSYGQRHNWANGEDNRDGHAHNFSDNHGVEGPSSDAKISAVRRRQRLNMLATLLFSQGTPMLLAGDEFGNSQGGNNNAYAQDNQTGWLDWSGLSEDPEFFDTVCRLVALRRSLPLLRQRDYRHGRRSGLDGWPNISWSAPDGKPLWDADWHRARALSMLLVDTPVATEKRGRSRAVAVLFNASPKPVTFQLPEDPHERAWELLFSSDPAPPPGNSAGQRLGPHSIACCALN